MIIYVSHPYGGLLGNKQKVEAIVRRLTKENPQHIYISPIHCFGYLYNDVDYETGLEMCLKLLEKCDKMLVFGNWRESRGCTAEVLFAGFHFIGYEIMDKE